MKEKIRAELLRRQPQHAEGRIRIDLTDPLTGKVKDRVDGENHIFSDTIFGQQKTQDQYSSDFYTWANTISKAQLLLTDSANAIDDNIPYVFGNVLGTGLASQSGSGTLQGAYNAANQKLAVFDGDSINWKFQYDFTTAQANGNIRTIGLSYQYINMCCALPDQIPATNVNYYLNQLTTDGRYAYRIDSSGVITKYDVVAGTYVSIDKSAVVGNSGNETKKIGYDPSTGYYYIFVYHYNTAANRKLYRFSDSTFSALLATYSVSNTSFSYYNYDYPVYVYGDFLFLFYDTLIYVCNYMSNTVFTTQAPSKSPLYSTYNYQLQYQPLPFQGRYLHVGGYYQNSSPGIIYDLQTQTVVAWEAPIYPPYCGSYVAFQAMSLYPGKNIPCYPGISSTTYGIYYPVMTVRTAIAARKLDTPVVKTTANGMTVTYELEVLY